MEEETKAKLQALFDADKQRKEAVVKQVDEQQEREKQFISDFKQVRDKVIHPALEDFAAFVNGQGWQTDISVEEDDRHDHTANLKPVRVSRFRSSGTSRTTIAGMTIRISA